MNTDILKFGNEDIFRKYKEEIVKDKEKYKPILLELLEQNKINHYIKEIIELWEKKWKEEANTEIDKLKFKYESILREYKEEIINDKERYKPILLELLEDNKIDKYIYEKIIEIWEKEWKEIPNIYIDKLKFKSKYDFEFSKYKEEIINDKERYKPVLLGLLEEDKINEGIYEKIIEIWEKEWKEEANIYIDKLKFYKSYSINLFKEYKEEIINDKERYKPVLLKALEEDKINEGIYEEIIEIWEKEWKEEANIYIDKLKFRYSSYYKIYLFKEYKEEIRKNKERYKPVLLKALEEDKINEGIYEEIIEIWEKEWKEEANIYIDKLKFYYSGIFNIYLFKEYKEEIINDKERYKPVLLELLKKDKIRYWIYKEIIEMWEKEWEEEANIYLDKLKFDDDIFRYYKEEIGKNKERYKPVLLELLEQDKLNKYIYEDIIKLWDNIWKEFPNVHIDKLKFYYYRYCSTIVDVFKEHKKEIGKNKERYKPILFKTLKEDKISNWIYEDIIEICDNEWKEEEEIEGNSELIDIDNINYFIENRDEIINNREKYEATVRRYFVPVTYREIKPILNSWGESDIELLTKLILKSTYRTYNILYSVLKDILIEHKDSIIENIKKNYKTKLKDKVVKLFILSTIQTIDELENKLKLLKLPKGKLENITDSKNMDKLIEHLIKLDLDKDIDSEVLENVVKIVTDKISEMEYIKLFIEIKKDKDNLSKNCINILKNILDKIENKETLENLMRELGFNNPIEMLKYLRNERVPIEITSCIEVLRDIFNKIDSKEKLDKVVEEYGFNNPIEMLKYLRDGRVPIEITSYIEVLRDIFNKIDSKEKLDRVVEEYGFNNPIEMLKYLRDGRLPIEIASCIEVLRDIFNKIDSKEKLYKVVEEYGFNNPIEMLKYLRDGRLPIEIASCIEVLRDIFNKIDSKEKLYKVVEEYGFNNPIEFLEELKVKKAPIEIIEIYYKLLEEYYSNEFDEFKKSLGERLLDKFDGSSYSKYVEYNRYRDILDNIYNYEDIMKFKVAIENGGDLNMEYSDKERIKIAYWSSYKPIKKLSKVEEYIDDILPKVKKYINYEIDDLGFNDKKERYFRYNDNNIVVKLKDRKLKIYNSSGKEIKKLSSTSKDFYTVRTLENIKELKAMLKNVYTDSDNGIKKEYCNNVLRDYNLWREIYIDNILLQEYATNLIWEEVDNEYNIVGRFRYVQDGEFCDSNDDEYIINKENRIRLLSLDKVSDDEVDRWREQLDDYEIIQPIPQLELYNLDYSDINSKNIEISNKEVELRKLEKNLTLRFKDEEMYFEIKNMLKIELEDWIDWVEYKTLSKDTILKISRINLLNKSDYSLRMVKLLKERLGI